MREDMGKIAVDSYRHGGYGAKKLESKRRRGKFAGDSLKMPTKASMSRDRNGGRGLGENLSPLYRWVAKQANRPWDKVYSEMTSALGGGYTNMEHIKSHIFDRVVTDEVRIIDGWPHRRPTWFRRDDSWVEMRRYEMYVDGNGILRAMPQRKPPSEIQRADENKRPEVVMLDGLTAAAKVDGVWFKAELVHVPIVEERVLDYSRSNPYRNPEHLVYRMRKSEGHFTDALWRKLRGKPKTEYNFHPNEWMRERIYGNRWLYAPKLRTMSKKEIRQRIPEELR